MDGIIIDQCRFKGHGDYGLTASVTFQAREQPTIEHSASLICVYLRLDSVLIEMTRPGD
jgi:hypothetical protein